MSMVRLHSGKIKTTLDMLGHTEKLASNPASMSLKYDPFRDLQLGQLVVLLAEPEKVPGLGRNPH